MGLFQTQRPSREDRIVTPFIVLIVLYETAPAASQSIATLLRCKGLADCRRVVVVDHSRRDQAAACTEACAGLPCPVTYLHDASNPPLGAAYNRALQAHLGAATYALLLDQDTTLSPDFLQMAVDAAQAHAEPSLMVPTIVTAHRIASPVWTWLGWGYGWKKADAGWFSLRTCTAIMSGCWIHRRAFTDWALSFNEQLRLYGVDTDFFRRLGRRDPRFYVLPLSLDHSLSFDEGAIDVKAEKLKQIFAANRLVFADAAWPTRVMLGLLQAVLRMKYALKYRSRIFLHP